MVYLVWLITDENQKEQKDRLFIETKDEDVALWFAKNYEFDYTENAIIQVLKLVLDNNDEVIDQEYIYEKRLTRN